MRHGETEWNALGKIQGGNLDLSLNETGRAQAQKIEETVFNLGIKKILHSPLRRAKETADIVNKRSALPMHTFDDFKEWNVGDWYGLSSDVFRSYVKQGLQPPNGETLSAFKHRVHDAFDRLVKDHNNFLIVAHGFTFNALKSKSNIQTNIESLSNCQFVEFEYFDNHFWRATEYG